MRFGPSQLSCLGSSVVDSLVPRPICGRGKNVSPLPQIGLGTKLSGRVLCLECRGFESHPRQLVFLRKSDCLGCAVLLCLICLTLLASFFLPSHLSLKHVHNYVIYMYMYLYQQYNRGLGLVGDGQDHRLCYA